MPPVPVAAELFASLDPPALAGSRCAACGTTAFPVARSCARCSGTDVETVALPTRGTVWTYTVQSFRPKAPYVLPGEEFAPFPVGYVDLGDLLVEGRIDVPREQLRLGLPVELALARAWQDEDGERVTFAFTAIAGGEA